MTQPARQITSPIGISAGRPGEPERLQALDARRPAQPQADRDRRRRRACARMPIQSGTQIHRSSSGCGRRQRAPHERRWAVERLGSSSAKAMKPTKHTAPVMAATSASGETAGARSGRRTRPRWARPATAARARARSAATRPGPGSAGTRRRRERPDEHEPGDHVARLPDRDQQADHRRCECRERHERRERRSTRSAGAARRRADGRVSSTTSVASATAHGRDSQHPHGDIFRSSARFAIGASTEPGSRPAPMCSPGRPSSSVSPPLPSLRGTLTEGVREDVSAIAVRDERDGLLRPERLRLRRPRRRGLRRPGRGHPGGGDSAATIRSFYAAHRAPVRRRVRPRGGSAVARALRRRPRARTLAGRWRAAAVLADRAHRRRRARRASLLVAAFFHFALADTADKDGWVRALQALNELDAALGRLQRGLGVLMLGAAGSLLPRRGTRSSAGSR